MVVLLSILGVLALVAGLLLRSWISNAGTTGIMGAPRDDDATTRLACRPQYGSQPRGSASAHINSQILWQNMVRELTSAKSFTPHDVRPSTFSAFDDDHSRFASKRVSAVGGITPFVLGDSLFFAGSEGNSEDLFSREDFALSAAVASATGSVAAGYAAGGSMAGAMSGEACSLSRSSLFQDSLIDWDSGCSSSFWDQGSHCDWGSDSFGGYSDHSHSDFDSHSSGFSDSSFGFD